MSSDSDPTLHTVMHHLEAQTVMIKRMDVALHGPEGAPEKGHVVRVDRLEQKQKLVWGALLTAVAGLFKSFWSVITGN